tara:strand:+ start:1166 stop:2413 length:1248 start_codon:yes stop_codon:yes gene_type:complete
MANPISLENLSEALNTSSNFSNNLTKTLVNKNELINDLNLKASLSGANFTGNVGIGTITPNSTLDIYNSSSSPNINLTGPNSSQRFQIGSHFHSASTDHVYLWNDNNTPIKIATNNTQRMIISENGNVGIGNTVPTYKLDINSGTSTYAIRMKNDVDADGWIFRNIANDKFAIHQETVGDRLTIHNGNVGIGTSPVSALHVYGLIDNQAALGAHQGIHIGHHGNGNIAFESVSAGVGNGCYFDFNCVGTSVPDFLARFYWGGANDNNFRFNLAIYTPQGLLTSDDRLKHNEQPIQNALSNIMQLNPQIYDKTIDMRDANYNGPLEDNKYYKEAGFIAQEIYEIDEFKEYVKVGDEDKSWALNYNSIFTYAVKAIQELKTEKDTLETKNTELENKVSTLETQLTNVLSRLSALENN